MTKRRPQAWHDKTKNVIETKLKPPHIFNSITSLHGINYFKVKKGRSLFLWTLLMIVHVILAISFLVIIKDRYNSDQIVTKVYSDWTVDKVPFPAVSICNFNRVSVNESRTIENILRSNKISQKEINSFFRDLHYLLDFEYGFADIDSHSDVLKILNSHYYSVDNIMEEVHQKCDNLLIYCSFNGIQKNCKDLFTVVQTYAGHCCTFNFNGLEDDYVDPSVTQDEDFEYYSEQGDDGESEVATNMISTSQSGSSSGLKVVYNVEPKDYGSYSLTRAYGAKILINDPSDFIETSVSYRYMYIGQSMDIKVEPLIYKSEENLKFIDPKIRGCWFYNEVNLVNTKRYSFETCKTECKIKSYWDYCGCVPYKYPVDKSTRTCEFSDLKCLNYMKGHWGTKQLPCVPKCYKECSDKGFTIYSDSVPFLPEYYPNNVIKGRNVSELSALHVYYMRSNCNCYMMTRLFDANTFIATYGGILCLFFGASLITTLELAYLLLEILVKIVWKKLKLYLHF